MKTRIFFYMMFILAILKVIFSDNKVNSKQNIKAEILKSIKKEECKMDSDCNELNHCEKNKCKHKSFFPPVNREIIGLMCIIVGSALSNAGGIGGGGLLIPILILILKFETHEAIPISKIMIFTGALTAFIIGLKNKHPYREAIALDYNIAGVLIPMILFGTIVGVTLNKVMPFSVILICLSFVLVINTYKTFKTAFKNYKLENFEMEQKDKEEKEEKGIKNNYQTFENKDKISTADEETLSLKGSETISQADSSQSDLKNINSNNSRYSDRDNNITSGKNNNDVSEQKMLGFSNSEKSTFETYTVREYSKDLIKEELRKDKVIFPIDKYKFILLTYVFLVIFTFLKGSEHLKSVIGITPCSGSYWTIYFMFLPLALGITAIFAKQVLTEYKKRLEMGFPYHHSDIKWSMYIIIKYPIYAFIGGVLAGVLGIGGGLVLGPMLLEMGINPIISTATSNFLVLFTSSSTTLQFIIMGMMNFDYGFICTICSTLGSLVGTLAIQSLLKKTGRPSILIFSLSIVLGISTILIPWDTSIKIKQKIDAGINIWVINSAC